jgi:hypothetical protein
MYFQIFLKKYTPYQGMEGVLPCSCNDGFHFNHGRSIQTKLDRWSLEHIRNLKSIPKLGASIFEWGGLEK